MALKIIHTYLRSFTEMFSKHIFNKVDLSINLFYAKFGIFHGGEKDFLYLFDKRMYINCDENTFKQIP